MTDTKWTPGPWTCDGYKNATIIPEDTGKQLATAWLPRPVDETRLNGESWLEMRRRTAPQRNEIDLEVSANAHLIAAAPELYEALAPVHDWATEHAADAPEWDEKSIVKVHLSIRELRMAVAALAKARGETQ